MDIFWGSTTKKKKRKVHYLPWDKLTATKENGCLGPQHCEKKTKVVLTSFSWRIFTDHISLWARTLIFKYNRQQEKFSQSFIWKTFSWVVLFVIKLPWRPSLWGIQLNLVLSLGALYPSIQIHPLWTSS